MAYAPDTLTIVDGTGAKQTVGVTKDTAANILPLHVRPTDWAVNNTSAAAGQGTISKSAGAAGVYHVCTGIYVQLVGDATGNADYGTFNLRDGASGAGTVLLTGRVSLASGANAVGTAFAMNGLNIVGSSATAMTLEFSASGATHTIQIVNMTGYDLQP